MSGGRGSYSRLSLHVGPGGWVTCHHYDGKTPILVIDAGESSVSISPAERDASGAALEFARALARRAQEFADDIERLHTAQDSGTDGTGADSSGTDDNHNSTADERAA